MSKLREGDILIFNTPDGGNIEITNGDPVMDGGFESAVYLSLFGGDGNDHWMSEYQNESEKIISRFYNFIKGNPKTVPNLNRAEELGKEDLQWFINDGIADTINFIIISEDINRIKVEYEILLNGDTLEQNNFKINWGFQQNTPGHERV